MLKLMVWLSAQLATAREVSYFLRSSALSVIFDEIMTVSGHELLYNANCQY